MIGQVVIRHLSGAKANQVEQFKLDGLNEMMIGRSAAAAINFEGPLHDGVSRRHGCIRVTRGRRLGFTIIDLGSSNGIWVNGRPVMDEQALLPDDVVELGAGGPSFRFDVQPSPFQPAGPSENAGNHEAIFLHALKSDVPDPETLNLVALDRATISEDGPGVSGVSPHVSPSKPVSRLRLAACVLLAALVGAGAGAFLYRQRPIPMPHSVQADPAQTGPVQAAFVQPAVPPAPIIMTTRQVARKLAGSVVSINVQWRLYDRFTGSPVFQRMLTRRGLKLPCFVALADGRIVPWLSTDDEDHTNNPIGGEVGGNGVIIGEQGAILTSRHVAAAWTTQYDLRAGVRLGALFQLQGGTGQNPASRLVDLDAPGAHGERLLPWLPSQGAILFRSRYPVAIGLSQNNLEGRNETMDVSLEPDQASTAGRLVRLSEDAALAELKIDTDQPLAAAEPAQSDLKTGDAVTILDYPAALPRSLGVPDAVPSGGGDGHPANVRQLSVIPGIVAARTGNSYRLSVPGTPVSSGSPVFDSRGRLVALAGPGKPVGDTGLDAYPVGFSRPLPQLQ